MTVFLLQTTSLIDGLYDCSIIKAFQDRNDAIALLKEKKQEDIDLWTGEGDDFTIEVDRDELFQMQSNYWEEYVELTIIPMHIE